MIIDLSNYRLKEDICNVSGDVPTTLPVIKLSDVLIGGGKISEIMAISTEGEAEYNSQEIPGVQYCRYYLLPEEIGLASYYEIYQALLTTFGTTEEELLANGREMELPISSIKLGDVVFNATSVYLDLAARRLDAEIYGQTFTIRLALKFINPNLAGSSGGGTFKEAFEIDVIR